jgi:predicted DNA-binding protein (MmcQ/YjbR family)
MNSAWVRKLCLSLPHTTEQMQWGDHLVFKIGGKMYAVTSLEPGGHWLSFKCTEVEFTELVERPNIDPAPYMARAHWVALSTKDALTRAELQRLIPKAYDLVFGKLPKKAQSSLGGGRKT